MSQNLWSAFIAANGSNQVLVASSPDTKSWTGSRFINQWSPFAPAMAYFNGSLYVAFITDDVAVSGGKSTPSNRIFITSTADGVTWTPASFFGQYSKHAPSLAVWNNSLYLAFVSNDNRNAVLVCSLSVNGVWGQAVDTGQSSFQAPTLAAFAPSGGTGILCLAFVAANPTNEILVCTYEGGSWQGNYVTGQSGKFSPSLASIGGNLYLGFAANNSTQEVLLCSSTNGSQWSPNNVPINQTSAASPSLSVFGNPSELCVSFIANNSGVECLLASSSTPMQSSSWLASNTDMKEQSYSAAALAVAPFACESQLEAPPGGGLKSNSNYLIWGGSCTEVVNLTDLTLTIEISSQLSSTDNFSFQWNTYSPASATNGLSTVWQQYLFIVDTNGNLNGMIDNWPSQPLRNAIYPDGSKAQQGSDLINDQFTLITGLPGATLPAGYKLVLQLTNDPNNQNITGASWTVYNNGVKVGSASRTLDQEPVSNEPSKTVSAAWLAPIVAFQVNLVGIGNPNVADLVSGQGTVSVSSANLMTATNSQPPCTSSQNIVTAETGNSVYSQLPNGFSKLMVQPFTF